MTQISSDGNCELVTLLSCFAVRDVEAEGTEAFAVDAVLAAAAGASLVSDVAGDSAAAIVRAAASAAGAVCSNAVTSVPEPDP